MKNKNMGGRLSQMLTRSFMATGILAFTFSTIACGGQKSDSTVGQEEVVALPDTNKVYTYEECSVKPVASQTGITAEEVQAYAQSPNQLQYPEEAKKQRVEGTVECSVVIERDGSVSDPKIVKGVDALLDNQVLKSVPHLLCHWTAAEIDSTKVRCQVLLVYQFKLDNKVEKDSTPNSEMYKPVVVSLRQASGQEEEIFSVVTTSSKFS